MYIDAHFHSDDLMTYVPDIPKLLAKHKVSGTASCHSQEGFLLASTVKYKLQQYYNHDDNMDHRQSNTTPSIQQSAISAHLHTDTHDCTMLAKGATTGKLHTAQNISITISFGIHPQAVDMTLIDLITELAGKGLINAIGECGFDFYGDRPSCLLNADNLALQKMAFTAQLDIAKKFSLPIIIHTRKAQALIVEFRRKLSELPAVIFHSWNGHANEARELIRHIPKAYFSFGTSLLNGNKKTFSSAGTVPLNHILTESDAPWQPPRNEPLPGSKTMREYSSPEDVPRILAFIAYARMHRGEFTHNYWQQSPDFCTLQEITDTVLDNYHRIYKQ